MRKFPKSVFFEQKLKNYSQKLKKVLKFPAVLTQNSSLSFAVDNESLQGNKETGPTERNSAVKVEDYRQSSLSKQKKSKFNIKSSFFWQFFQEMQSKKDHLEAVKCLLAYDVNVVAKTTDEVNNSSNKKTKTASFKESNQVQKTYCFRRRYFTKLK